VRAPPPLGWGGSTTCLDARRWCAKWRRETRWKKRWPANGRRGRPGAKPPAGPIHVWAVTNHHLSNTVTGAGSRTGSRGKKAARACSAQPAAAVDVIRILWPAGSFHGPPPHVGRFPAPVRTPYAWPPLGPPHTPTLALHWSADPLPAAVGETRVCGARHDPIGQHLLPFRSERRRLPDWRTQLRGRPVLYPKWPEVGF